MAQATKRDKKSTKGEAGGEGDAVLHEDALATLERMKAVDPGLKKLLKNAHAHAVLPSVAKAAAVVGGAYGRGEVFEGGKPVGYVTLGQLTIGVQIGGDTFSELIVFESPEPFERFKQNKMKFAANASAVLVKAGAATTTNYEKGAKVFVHSEGGMMLELALGGQKFKFKPADGQGDANEQGGQKGKKGQARAQQDEEGDESQDEGGDEDSMSSGEGSAGGIMQLVRQHPVMAAVVGAGLATGAFLFATRVLSASAGSSARGEDDQDEDDDDRDEAEDDDRAEGSYDDDDEEDEDEDEDRDSDEDYEDDDEADDQDDGEEDDDTDARGEADDDSEEDEDEDEGEEDDEEEGEEEDEGRSSRVSRRHGSRF